MRRKARPRCSVVDLSPAGPCTARQHGENGPPRRYPPDPACTPFAELRPAAPGMEFQNQVRQSLPDDFTRLQGLLANEVFARRSEVADRVCEAFGLGVVACSERAA